MCHEKISQQPRIIQLQKAMASDICTLTWFKYVVQVGIKHAIPAD